MAFLTALGALLGGATSEAQKIHEERFRDKQLETNLRQSMYQHVMDNPYAPADAKAWAYQAAQDHLMELMFPDQYQGDNKNPVRKLTDQFIDQTKPGPAAKMSQPGVGRGNARPTQLGASQPPMGGGTPPQTQMPGPPPGSMVGSAGGVVPSPTGPMAGMQPPPQFGQPGQWGTPASMAGATQAATLPYVEPTAAAKARGEIEGSKITLGFDIGPYKAGTVIDPRLAQTITESIRLMAPHVHTDTYNDSEGNRHLKLIDDNPMSRSFGSELKDMKDGQVLDASRTGEIGYLRALQRVKAEKVRQAGGDPTAVTLTPEEDLQGRREWATTGAQASAEARLPYQEMLSQFANQLRTELGESRTSRVEVAKAFEPLRQGTVRYNTMQQAYDRIASGKSTAPGADDMILLSNHIGMTFGDVPGARTGRDIIEAHRAAIAAVPRLELAVKRVLNGEQLTEGQRKEFLTAAKDRLGELKDSFDRTKKIWNYEPPGSDEAFQLPGQKGGGAGKPNLGAAFQEWMKNRVGAPPLGQ